MTGITSGAPNEAQPLSIAAVSSNPALIPNPTVNYTSPNAAGSLSFAPVANGNGTAIITVTVNDGSTSNALISPERRAVALSEGGALANPEVLRYLNRLADLLWVLARYEDRHLPLERLTAGERPPTA